MVHLGLIITLIWHSQKMWQIALNRLLKPVFFTLHHEQIKLTYMNLMCFYLLATNNKKWLN